VIVSLFIPTKVAACATPLKVTVEESTNPIPLTVRSWDAAPALATLGNRELIVGTGLPDDPVTENVSELVVEPLLVATLMGPEDAPAGTVVWIDEAVELPTWAAVPLKVTSLLLGFGSKPVPVMVTVAPASPVAGLRPVAYGGVTVMLAPVEGEIFVVDFG